jgi:hypothetical protein
MSEVMGFYRQPVYDAADLAACLAAARICVRSIVVGAPVTEEYARWVDGFLAHIEHAQLIEDDGIPPPTAGASYD